MRLLLSTKRQRSHTQSTTTNPSSPTNVVQEPKLVSPRTVTSKPNNTIADHDAPIPLADEIRFLPEEEPRKEELNRERPCGLSAEEKQRFLRFTSILLMYLGQKDPPMKAHVKSLIRDCMERHERGMVGYESTTLSMKRVLEREVPLPYRERAELYLRMGLKARELKKLTPPNEIQMVNLEDPFSVL